MNAEDYVSAGMAKVREAVARAPSHEELFAGIEAMFRHLVSPPERDAELGEQTEMSGADYREDQIQMSAATPRAVGESEESSASNPTTSQAGEVLASPSANDQT
jgi:hypothetical protein